MERIGIELGIRAPLSAVEKAAIIADRQMLDYYFIPETHSDFMGVNAFEALARIIPKIEHVILGTGIMNVYSRTKNNLLQNASKVYNDTQKKFVLGLGTSAHVIIENMYKMRFEKPLSRIKEYTKYIKSRYDGTIYWSAVGDKMTMLSAECADGVIFFLKPESEVKHSITILRNKLRSVGKNYDTFEIISILPLCINDSEKKGRNSLRMTIANYVGANEFYSKPLERAGFVKEVKIIRKNFLKYGLASAAAKVTDKMIEALGVCGDPAKCATGIKEFSERTGLKTVVTGFDLPRQEYSKEFLKNIERFSSEF
jgi:alkanesulfonate monooxygenase SsuD/methylene tetrahydromethanopterin reductase-like flavin-dependent oxidoreductase (luciferase family)